VRQVARSLILSLLLAVVALPTASAEDFHPHLITYGPAASPEEGDPDHRQTIYVALPAIHREVVFLRIYDMDVSDTHDTRLSAAPSTTRFSLYGGPGAYRGPLRERPGGPGADKFGGHLLKERIVGKDASLDDRWTLFASMKPADGDRFGDRLFFRLEVVGESGADGNIFDVEVSSAETSSVQVAGAELFTYDLGFRARTPEERLEARFLLPKDATRLTAHNFDATGGVFAIATPYRSIPSQASENGRWRSQSVDIRPEEQGRTAGISFFGGRETPNDLSAYITVSAASGSEHPLPVLLPVRVTPDNAPPTAEALIQPLSCTDIRFDASLSSDAEGDPLSYLWRFPGGTTATTSVAEKAFPGPGRYKVHLEVSDGDGKVENTQTRQFTVTLKEPPTPVLGEIPRFIGVGEPLRLDATASRPGSGAGPATLLADYEWTVGGKSYSGPVQTVELDTPGSVPIRLTVREKGDTPCGTASAVTEITVNAPPVAKAGKDLDVRVGEPIEFDGTGSEDPDGKIARYEWDFGDGARAAGAKVRYAYPKPGTYQARLTVEDNAFVANSRASDSATITVVAHLGHTAPVAEIVVPEKVYTATPVIFDGSSSRAPDGNILAYHWSFGDGATASGARVRHRYHKPGTYEVSLTVEDDSGAPQGKTTDTVSVEVEPQPNTPPVADAGGNRTARVGERLLFSGLRSTDEIGEILSYDWEFGDGARDTGAEVVHAYKKAGTYTVELGVTDNASGSPASASDRITVTVVD